MVWSLLLTAGSEGPTLISCTASHLLSSVRSWHTVVCLSHDQAGPRRVLQWRTAFPAFDGGPIIIKTLDDVFANLPFYTDVTEPFATHFSKLPPKKGKAPTFFNFGHLSQHDMTPQAAAEKAFKRIEEIFAKYPIAQS